VHSISLSVLYQSHYNCAVKWKLQPFKHFFVPSGISGRGVMEEKPIYAYGTQCAITRDSRLAY
jgi:hypothetical protein